MKPISPTDGSSPERATDPLSRETSHTDPGPPLDVPPRQRDRSDLEDRHEMIAEAAYYRAEQRGFELGYEDMDWLEAEQELLERLARDEAEAMY